MNLTNAEPSPKSRREKDSRNTVKSTHTPNSPAVRWRQMNGVSRRVAARLQNLPTKLKNVLAISFREKPPRKVMGWLFCAVGSIMTFNGELRDSLTPLLKNGTFYFSVLRRSNVFTIAKEEMIPNGPV